MRGPNTIFPTHMAQEQKPMQGWQEYIATVYGLASIKNKKLPALNNEILSVRILIFSA